MLHYVDWVKFSLEGAALLTGQFWGSEYGTKKVSRFSRVPVESLSGCRKALSASPAKNRRIEADLQALAAIVDGSRDALWSWTPKGIIVRWNTEAERLFGYTAEEIIGRSVLTLVPPDRHQQAREIIQKAVQGEGHGQYETVRIRKDGTELDVELTVSPITDKRGKVVGCLSSCRDISERKHVQSSLAERINELTTLICSAVTASGDLGVSSTSPTTWLSWIWPPVTAKFSGRPLLSTMAWIFVERPPRLTPIA